MQLPPGNWFAPENEANRSFAHIAEWSPRRSRRTVGIRLNLRIRSELKKKLESVAESERRSVAQICEAFLQAGLVAYNKEGAKYISRFLAITDGSAKER